jgi:hypothetical protein
LGRRQAQVAELKRLVAVAEPSVGRRRRGVGEDVVAVARQEVSLEQRAAAPARAIPLSGGMRSAE